MSRPVGTHPLPARQRTVLLHRMLLLRHLTEGLHRPPPGDEPADLPHRPPPGEQPADLPHRPSPGEQPADLPHRPSPGAGPIGRPAHDEALAAGVVSALGPGDTLVAAGWPATLLLSGHAGATGPGDARVAALHLPPAAGSTPGVLFCPVHHLRAVAPSEATAAVPGSDVEAITCTAVADIAAVRSGAGSCLLALEAADDDPVELLAARMRLDHQLDDGTLRAMDRDAAARATVLLAAAAPGGPPGRVPRL